MGHILEAYKISHLQTYLQIRDKLRKHGEGDDLVREYLKRNKETVIKAAPKATRMRQILLKIRRECPECGGYLDFTTEEGGESQWYCKCGYGEYESRSAEDVIKNNEQGDV